MYTLCETEQNEDGQVMRRVEQNPSDDEEITDSPEQGNKCPVSYFGYAIIGYKSQFTAFPQFNQGFDFMYNRKIDRYGDYDRDSEPDHLALCGRNPSQHGQCLCSGCVPNVDEQMISQSSGDEETTEFFDIKRPQGSTANYENASLEYNSGKDFPTAMPQYHRWQVINNRDREHHRDRTDENDDGGYNRLERIPSPFPLTLSSVRFERMCIGRELPRYDSNPFLCGTEESHYGKRNCEQERERKHEHPSGCDYRHYVGRRDLIEELHSADYSTSTDPEEMHEDTSVGIVYAEDINSIEPEKIPPRPLGKMGRYGATHDHRTEMYECELVQPHLSQCPGEKLCDIQRALPDLLDGLTPLAKSIVVYSLNSNTVRNIEDLAALTKERYQMCHHVGSIANAIRQLAHTEDDNITYLNSVIVDRSTISYGKDSLSDRNQYVKCSPLLKYLFPRQGKRDEITPPVIPLILLNGTHTAVPGLRCRIPLFDRFKIITCVREYLTEGRQKFDWGHDILLDGIHLHVLNNGCVKQYDDMDEIFNEYCANSLIFYLTEITDVIQDFIEQIRAAKTLWLDDLATLERKLRGEASLSELDEMERQTEYQITIASDPELSESDEMQVVTQPAEPRSSRRSIPVDVYCGACDIMLHTQGALDRHNNHVHPEIKFMCPLCDLWYKTSTARLKHMKTKHTDEILECKLCDISITDVVQFYNHNKTAHPQVLHPVRL